MSNAFRFPHDAERPRRRIDASTIQVALGGIWLFDGLLQLQPKMFSQSFVTHVMQPTAAGQPSWLAAAILHFSNFVGNDVALWNTLLALTQIALGVGIILRRTRKRALGASLAWAAFVWVIGEGMGGLLTGSASPLMGAPGAVLLYALVAVLAWPTERRSPVATDERLASASSPSADGPLGPLGALACWAGLFGLFAVLFVLPDNRGPAVIQQNIAMMSSGEPSWYSHFLASIGHAFVGSGTWVSVILAGLCLVTALGPLFSRRPDAFLALGAAMSVGFWITGQALGSLFSGTATDPNAGPLIVLVALALRPSVPAAADAPIPAAVLFARRPRVMASGIGLAVFLPVAVAAIPLAPMAGAAASPAHQTSGHTGSGMKMPGGVIVSDSAGSKSKAGKSSSSMKMGTGKMNMSGMAGLGVTATHWRYTGPALPNGEAQLLSQVSATEDEGHSMQTPDCTASPTANQVLGATEYIQAVSAAVAKYQFLSVAVKAGYIPVTSTAYPVVHYVNPAYMQQKYVLDPNHVDSLVYAFTPNGPVLVAAMFLLPSQTEKGPMPYGCLVQWHAHTNLCMSDTTHTVVGFTPCSPGTYNQRTAYMTHVWQVPVPGGPLAIDPSDLVTMEAAMQAQQEGLAPITPKGGQSYYKTASSGQVGTF